MKNLIIAFVTLLSVNYAFAQNKKITTGIKFGANLSQIKSDGKGQAYFENDETRSVGFTGGVFARFGNKFFIQPEIMISTKGGKLTVFESALFDTKKTIDYRSTYLDFPVLVGGKIGDVVRLNVGPVATFLINQDGKFKDNFNEENEPAFSKAILGYQAGVGFDIGRINLDMRYEGNVNDVFNIDYNDQQTASKFAAKGNLFLFTVGFAF